LNTLREVRVSKDDDRAQQNKKDHGRDEPVTCPAIPALQPVSGCDIAAQPQNTLDIVWLSWRRVVLVET
jgi:hypothetical protein